MTHSILRLRSGLRAWNTIRKRMIRLPFFVAEHAFPFTLLFIAVVGAFSLALFYVYGFSAQTKHVEQGASLYDIKEGLFQDTLGKLEERSRALDNVSKETFRDIFNPELTPLEI
jgi:hypothetical protein